MKNNNIHRIERNITPTILTIFGSTGDLAADYLIPALLHMHEEKLFPAGFKLVCVGRRELTTRQYLEFILKKSSNAKKISRKNIPTFLRMLEYFQGGDFTDEKSFSRLSKTLADHERGGTCYNRLYYMATSPEYFGQLARSLKKNGLLTACAKHERRVRVMVEKPFGSNYKTARDLNGLLLKYFTEEQVYRIDHYLGKETVQNLLVVRFANSIFEPLWNNRHIDHIQISVLEKDTVGERAAYYDQTGALRDMVQNHMLQMLSLITMDEPRDMTADSIRDEKLKVLKALEPFENNSLMSRVGLRHGVTDTGRAVARPYIIRGQYQGYAKETGKKSQTETFLAMKVGIQNKRWQGVPIYLRTGKALSKKVAEISIHFKEPLRCIFRYCNPNVLTFRIQPDESVHLYLNNKIPGFGVNLHQGDYEFGYSKAFMSEIPSAYERLLLDFMEGDQRLFIRSDEVEQAWKFVDGIRSKLGNYPLHSYKPGTNGPGESEKIMEGDMREWKTK